jgi:hypothetical protein
MTGGSMEPEDLYDCFVEFAERLEQDRSIPLDVLARAWSNHSKGKAFRVTACPSSEGLSSAIPSSSK